MIKNRNILILAAVLLVLLGISLVQKAGYRKSTSRSSTDTIVAETLTADQLERITLGQGDDAEAVDLVSTPTGWVAASAWDAPVSSSRIDALLKNLSGLSGEFRSDEAKVLADYGLGDEEAVKVRVYGKDGALAAAVDIGGKPERSPGNFVKRPDSSVVYLATVNLLSQMGLYDGPARPASKHFLDLQVVKEDRLAVDRVILNDGGQVLNLAKVFPDPKPTPGLPEAAEGDSAAAAAEEPAGPDRTTWEWKLESPAPKALAKTKADGVMNAVVGLRAVDVDDPTAAPADYGLEIPSRTVTLVMEDGSNRELAFGAKREAEGDLQAGVWMQIVGEPQVWVVTEYTVNNIFKSRDDLLPDQE